MPAASENPSNSSAAEEKRNNGECFAIMPISDHPDYPTDHFGEVYESIISPAIVLCNYTPLRADQVTTTNLIHLDILKRIYEAPIAVCDLSSANPNVMFELGIRQAFDKPVVLIKDNRTRSIFDIDNIRTITYDAGMRPRSVRQSIEAISAAIQGTVSAKPKDGANSIVSLMGLHAAALKHSNDDPNEARFKLMEQQLKNIAAKIDGLPASQVSDLIYRGYGNRADHPGAASNIWGLAGPSKINVVDSALGAGDKLKADPSRIFFSVSRSTDPED